MTRHVGEPSAIVAPLRDSPPRGAYVPWSPIEDGVLRLLIELGYGAAWAAPWFPSRTEASIRARMHGIRTGSVPRRATDLEKGWS